MHTDLAFLDFNDNATPDSVSAAIRNGDLASFINSATPEVLVANEGKMLKEIALSGSRIGDAFALAAIAEIMRAPHPRDTSIFADAALAQSMKGGLLDDLFGSFFGSRRKASAYLFGSATTIHMTKTGKARGVFGNTSATAKSLRVMAEEDNFSRFAMYVTSDLLLTNNGDLLKHIASSNYQHASAIALAAITEILCSAQPNAASVFQEAAAVANACKHKKVARLFKNAAEIATIKYSGPIAPGENAAPNSFLKPPAPRVK